MAKYGRRYRLFGQKVPMKGLGRFVGLLDEVSGATFAASVRLLRADYSGGLARVIAYNGATQFGAADVMPYLIGDEYWLDLNSTLENLDATAIGRGLTTSDTLADLCSVGVNDYDGLAPTWYGQQSGATNNATQTNVSNMPTIVNAGALNLLNGKPAVQQISNGRLTLDTSFTLNTSFSVANTVSENSVNYLYGSESVTTGVLLRGTFSGVNGLTSFDGSSLRTLGNAETSNQELQNVYIDSNSNLAINGNPLTNAGSTNTITVEHILGRRILDPLNGNVNELIFYPSDQTSNKSLIESNINNAFSIYP